MSILQRRFISVAAAAVAVVGLIALPTGAKASLIGDFVTVEADVCAPENFNLGNCTDTVEVTAGTEFTTPPHATALNIETNLFQSQNSTASFIDINAETIDFFFDFTSPGGFFFTHFEFTGLEWQGLSGGLVDGDLDVVFTTGTLSSDPQFTFVTASSFTVSVDCSPVGTLGTCTGPFGGVGFTVNLNPVHNGDGTPVIPLPAALPLFASGLGMLGIAGWRRKRQAAA